MKDKELRKEVEALKVLLRGYMGRVSEESKQQPPPVTWRASWHGVTHWVTERWQVDASYCDFSKEFDVPTGYVLQYIVVECKGAVAISGIALRWPLTGMMASLVPPVILENRPLTSPNLIIVPFEVTNGLDFRTYKMGDVRLGLTLIKGEGSPYPCVTLWYGMRLKI